MKIEDLMSLQREFDSKHGWIPASGNAESLIRFLQEDAIGLTGEVGEVCGIIKQLNLERRNDPSSLPQHLNAALPDLSEELIDVLIYLTRMLDYLNVDVEGEFRRKLAKNDEKFQRFENTAGNDESND